MLYIDNFIRIVALVFIITLTDFPAVSALDADTKLGINSTQMTIRESLIELEKFFDVKITLCGEVKNIASKKVSLNLHQNTLEHGIKEILRKAGIQSHSLIFDEKKKAVYIWIMQGEFFDEKEVASVLTKTQMQQLNLGDDSKPAVLTKEQMEQLYSADCEMDEKLTLNEEQMQLLDQEENCQPKFLNQAQMQELISDRPNR